MIKLASIWDSACQRTIFRRLLDVTAYPGMVHDLSDLLEDCTAEVGLLAALVDNTVTFCDVDGRLSAEDRHMMAALPAAVEDAAFVLVDASCAPAADFRPRLGDLYRPEMGATLILAGQELGGGDGSLEITGPGVQAARRLPLAGFHPGWFSRRTQWIAGFPTGVDFILCDRQKVAAVPRTSKFTVHI
jgi:phosphonate C-P lyase system protein PhnH